MPVNILKLLPEINWGRYKILAFRSPILEQWVQERASSVFKCSEIGTPTSPLLPRRLMDQFVLEQGPALERRQGRAQSAPPRIRIAPSTELAEEICLVRHQPIESILESRTGADKERLIQMAGVMGKMEARYSLRKNARWHLLGGGVLVSDNLLLTSAHCTPNERVLRVTFTDYASAEQKTYSYAAVPVSKQEFKWHAEKIGLKLGVDEDVYLLELKEKTEGAFPAYHPEITSGVDTEKPRALTHLGFKGGALHVSIASERMVSPQELLKRGVSLEGESLCWSAFRTTGKVEDSEALSEQMSRLRVSSEGTEHALVVTPDSSEKLFKNGKRSDLTVYVRRPILEAHDHAIVGHKTGEASSGGTYWDEAMPFEKSLYGIHCGKVNPQYLAGALEQHFSNHLVLRPGCEPTSPFVISWVDFETKPLPLTAVRITEFFLCKELKLKTEEGQKSLGYISKISQSSDRTKYKLVLINADGKPHAELVFLTNKNKAAIKYGAEAEQELDLGAVSIVHSDFTSTTHDMTKDVKPAERMAYITMVKKDDGHCILGVKNSAINAVPDDYKDMIRRFEAAIATREISITDMTNGTRGECVLKGATGLEDVIGHTGVSVKNHKRASASDVKLYLGGVERVVYRYVDRQLVYDAELSRLAGH